MGWIKWCAGLILSSLAMFTWAASPQERVAYWQNNFDVLTAELEPRVTLARKIFQQVLNAAGSPRSVTPRLLIIKDKSLRVIALPDGWVILSSGALERCYKNTNHGDDRLAFILGHEIAHQLKDDFWHMRFFEALSNYEKTANSPKDTLESVRAIAKKTDEVRAKELAADEHGIVYAAMAGFDPRAIIEDKQGINFFAEWTEALDPGRLRLNQASTTHPNSNQRAQAVKARLASVFEHIEAFNLGVMFHQAGMHQQAIASFGLFATYFPSREVSHNLAVSYYHLALQAYTQWKGEPDFALLPRLDPETRANAWASRDAEPPEERFQEHIALAIRHARAAVEQDSSYPPAYLTAAASLLLNNQPYEALGLLREAQRRFGANVDWLNAEGVAHQLTGDTNKATAQFQATLQTNPNNDAAHYNLGRQAILNGDPQAARQYWQACLDQAPDGQCAHRARRALGLSGVPMPTLPSAARESIDDIYPGLSLDQLPRKRRPISRGEVPADEYPYEVLRYADGLFLVAQEERVLLMGQVSGSTGRSARGIARGDSTARLRAVYGEPDRKLASGEAEIWCYSRMGINFQVNAGVVRSWLLFAPNG